MGYPLKKLSTSYLTTRIHKYTIQVSYLLFNYMTEQQKRVYDRNEAIIQNVEVRRVLSSSWLTLDMAEEAIQEAKEKIDEILHILTNPSLKEITVKVDNNE